MGPRTVALPSERESRQDFIFDPLKEHRCRVAVRAAARWRVMTLFAHMRLRAIRSTPYKAVPLLIPHDDHDTIAKVPWPARRCRRPVGCHSSKRETINGQHHSVSIHKRDGGWDPISEDFLRGFTLRLIFSPTDAEPRMRIDAAEDDKAYTVKAEIPGVCKDDIRVSVDGDRVSISAEVKKEKEAKEGRKVVRRERYFGSVSRSFSLERAINEEKVQARYEDGLLVRPLPKKPGANGKHIKVA